jgi:transcriptional regulator with XRE-family HTH domain
MINMRMKIDTIKFGEFIAERRTKIYGRQSQNFLAEKLSIAGSTMNNIENGKRGLSFGLFVDLADALQMTPGELMMVMAGREQKTVGYMELNNWLFEKLIRLIREYQELTKMTPEEIAKINARMKAEAEEIDLLATMTPHVTDVQKGDKAKDKDTQEGKEQEIHTENDDESTENS